MILNTEAYLVKWALTLGLAGVVLGEDFSRSTASAYKRKILCTWLQNISNIQTHMHSITQKNITSHTPYMDCA